ncbi:MAG: hypothetical protein QOK25_1763 [Thermoleophilaceae bacterium]|nr:hypothetical protein [Thermoleophilaceae bacterium]
MRVTRLLVLAAALGLGACGGSSGGTANRAVQRQAAQGKPPAPLAVARVRAIDPAAYRYDVTHGARIQRDSRTGVFSVVSTAPARPRAVVVAVHGHSGSAFSTYRLWQPYTSAHRLGLVVVEWQTSWVRPGKFLDAQGTYDTIARAVRRLGVGPGHVLLHGFSKGSKLAFPLTSLDRARRQRLFALTIAESGGIGLAPAHDRYLAGTRWWIYCAGSEQYPRIAGCGVMRRANAYLLANGARIERFLVDPPARHGGFLLDPKAVERALADFARVMPR